MEEIKKNYSDIGLSQAFALFWRKSCSSKILAHSISFVNGINIINIGFPCLSQLIL